MPEWVARAQSRAVVPFSILCCAQFQKEQAGQGGMRSV